MWCKSVVSKLPIGQDILNMQWIVVLGMLLMPIVNCDDPHSPHTEGTRFRYAIIRVNITNPREKTVTMDFTGRFGISSLIVNKLTGMVVQPMSYSSRSSTRKDNLGCSKYVTKVPSTPWIALVERGVCDFTEKVKIATKLSNASAIVIYNNETSKNKLDLGVVMNHLAMDSVSAVINRRDGLKMIKYLHDGYHVVMTLEKGAEGIVRDADAQNGISKTSVLFVTISFIVLMIISLVWLVFYYIQRFRYSHAKERLARRLACAAKKAIAKIPQRTLKVGDKELDTDFDQCAVCIEAYKAHDVVRILACRHVFHKSCVDPWLLDQRTCPMCKMDILREYGPQIGGSQDSVHQDAELGHHGNAVYVEPEASSSVDEGAPTEEVKVLLVPHTCLHLHMGGEGRGPVWSRSDGEDDEEDDYDEELEGERRGACASTRLIAARLEPSSPGSSSSSPSTSNAQSLRQTRADEAVVTKEGEMVALIARGRDGEMVEEEENKDQEEEEDDIDHEACHVVEQSKAAAAEEGFREDNAASPSSGDSGNHTSQV